MFVSSYEMIKKAQRDGYAVPAFNAENMEMLQGIMEACKETRSPVIIQTTPPTVKYVGASLMVAMVSSLAASASIPVALHLDHCSEFDEVMAAIRAGYTSVMFDGSKMEMDENIQISAAVKRTAAPMDVSVEAELGTVGGKEDHILAEVQYTEPAEALRFIEETKVDMLAIAIGTAHGFYKGEPKLDFKRLETIRKMTDTPLVLHGGSGIPDEMIRKSIRLGMCKINFATELRAAAAMGVREVLTDDHVIDPKKFMAQARVNVKELCKKKIALCGSANRA